MKFIHATVYKKKASQHAQVETDKVLFPLEAICALKVYNAHNYIVIFKKSWLLDLPYEIERVEANIQIHELKKLDIEVL